MKSTNPTTPILVGALAVASIIGATVFVFHGSSDTTTSASTTPTTSQASSSTPTTASSDTTTTTTTSASSTSSGYKDGTYTASASYRVPGGSNSISVTVTVKDGVVASVKTSNDYSDRESGFYIDSFDSSVQSAAVGKALDVASSLSRVGGASDTTIGFDDALATIANQAKA